MSPSSPVKPSDAVVVNDADGGGIAVRAEGVVAPLLDDRADAVVSAWTEPR